MWIHSLESPTKRPPLPQSGTPWESDLPSWGFSAWRLPSIWPRAAPLSFSKGQCYESKKRGRLCGGEERGHGGLVVGSDSEEEVMSLPPYCRFRMGNLNLVCPFCVRQGHWASWECSEGWEWAACTSTEGGLCVFCWLMSILLHAFSVPKVSHASVSTSFPRISSADTSPMANNRTKPKSEPLFSTEETACQRQRSETACSVLVCLSSMAHAIFLSVITCILGEVEGMPSATYTEFFWNHDVKRMPFHVKKLLFYLEACYFVFLRPHFTCLGVYVWSTEITRHLP